MNQAHSLATHVAETFFSVEVADMQRATAFYVDARSHRGVLVAGLVVASIEVAPGVVIAQVIDTEGNGFTLSPR